MPEVVSTPKAPQAIGPYSQAIKHNGLVFLSGQIPLDAAGNLVDGGIVEQTRQVLNNIQNVLDAAGSSLTNVLKATVFLKSMDDFAEMNKVYSEFFSDHKPARSTIQVAKLPRDVSVEIEVVAACS
ncbi:MAG: RidA family protein [Candidatus Obscuribacter sp.]|jgi:2-iminobutanoate/2-iminopropanoate deaminase|nr:RidA family protein [Candidatus Obscuribacter sp.]MDQ5966019.1 2-iminobutanoate/2-iminopropanoate deaminase [Cyanobacteriota bacterium erpe_2018_sw_39hr_WHONDRS-SW48-000098_B_bin.30]MBK7838119.1 RidA family protein [Candidatus Obscuribacter sp.]MBK9203626.1 RidA family protein [Candidatus Obscuribacter sp.]MBK9622001.1 RidA family protein [Candidatus Obscuribacter sp.]